MGILKGIFALNFASVNKFLRWHQNISKTDSFWTYLGSLALEWSIKMNLFVSQDKYSYDEGILMSILLQT
jgi:hypothetical protein